MINNAVDATPRSSSPDRHIQIPGTFNLRDVGGYQTADGGHTRWRTLWRSDSLHRLTPADQQTVIDLGVKTVIDLRHANETDHAPSVFLHSEQVHYHNIPLMSGNPATDAMPPADLVEVYKYILDSAQPAVKQVIETVLESESSPVLIHCTAGKDRTGMVIALLLGAVGVPEAQIVVDYALTEQYIQPLLIQLRQHAAQNGIDQALHEKMLACSPDLMDATLQYLDQRYGGIPAYLTSIGIDAQAQQRLHRMLVESAAESQR